MPRRCLRRVFSRTRCLTSATRLAVSYISFAPPFRFVWNCDKNPFTYIGTKNRKNSHPKRKFFQKSFSKKFFHKKRKKRYCIDFLLHTISFFYIYTFIVFAREVSKAAISGLPSTFISSSGSAPSGMVILFSSSFCSFSLYVTLVWRRL